MQLLYPPDLAKPAPRRWAAGGVLARSHWLVVEGDPAQRDGAARLLASLGAANVDFAADGLEAIVAVNRAPYDAVLMDWDLHFMKGPEAAALLRKRGHGGAIIGTGAVVTPRRRRACLQAGMDAFLGKPLCGVQLSECVSQLPGMRGAAMAPAGQSSKVPGCPTSPATDGTAADRAAHGAERRVRHVRDGAGLQPQGAAADPRG